MNKISISGNIDLYKGKYIIECINKECVINIYEDVYLYLVNDEVEKLNINVFNNSKVNVYKYNEVLNNNIELNIKVENNSVVNCNMAYTTSIINYVKINCDIVGDNNNVYLNLRAVSNDAINKIDCILNILKSNNNIAIENLKGICNGGIIEINPVILCETDNVSANHFTTVGCIKKEELNYLASKGINEIDGKNLLLKGFLLSNMFELDSILGGEFYE